MMYPEIEIDVLSAYVDGELDPATAARVADVAARDPAVASQIAKLAKLKSLMSEALKVDITLDDIPELTPQPPARGRWCKWVVAASLAAFTFLAASTEPPPELSSSPAETTLSDFVRARHDAWVTKLDVPSRLFAEFAGDSSVVASFVAPDLSDAKLSLRAAEMFDLGSDKIMQFGYVGSRGCRLSFFVVSRANDSLVNMKRGRSTRFASWLQGEIGYAVMADGMDKSHFGTIVQVLREYSIEPRPFDRTTADRLVASRSRSSPCFA